ncbi:MAG: hypothetical protein GY948_17215 [Alphaproteobacteria bacterium]|nr:hypothetical protein [Alphaproteobacteria bacterium]
MSTDDLIKIGGAIAIILLFIFIAIAIFRRIGGEVRGKRGSRLAVTEFRELDKLRHLVLIRRDNEEHLLLIGGPQDVVIETNIGRYEDNYSVETAAVHRVPPPQDRGEPAVTGAVEPKLPPPAPQQYEDMSDLPPPLKVPGPR